MTRRESVTSTAAAAAVLAAPATGCTVADQPTRPGPEPVSPRRPLDAFVTT
jgi:hypothetical protein